MRIGWAHFSIFVLIFSLACDESLPPRNDPTNFLQAEVRPTYVYGQASNNVTIQVAVVNRFDETIDGLLDLEGSVSISAKNNQQTQKTINIVPTDLIHGFHNPITGALIIDPGDSAVFKVVWDLTDDLFHYLPFTAFQYSVDPTCTQRMISMSEVFTVAARIKLYAQAGYASSQSSFAFRHLDRWVAPKECQNSTGLLVTTFWTDYVYNQNENDLRVLLSAKTGLDHPFRDGLALDGNIVIKSIRDSSVHKTLQLSPVNLVYGQYDPNTGALTLATGDSVVFEFIWNFNDDGVRDLRTSLFRYFPDNSCDSSHKRFIALPEYFDITSRWRLTATSGYTTTHGIVKICHINTWIDSTFCPSMFPNPHCLVE